MGRLLDSKLGRWRSKRKHVRLDKTKNLTAWYTRRRSQLFWIKLRVENQVVCVATWGSLVLELPELVSCQTQVYVGTTAVILDKT